MKLSEVATVEQLQERVNALLKKPTRHQCPACHGQGVVTRPYTQVEISEAAGIPQVTFSTFIRKGRGLSFANGFKLAIWLQRNEVPDPLEQLDEEHTPKSPGPALRNVEPEVLPADVIAARNRAAQLIGSPRKLNQNERE